MTDSPDRFKRPPRELALTDTQTHRKGPRWYVGSFSWTRYKHTDSERRGQPVTRRACPHEPDTHEHTQGGHRDE